MLLKAVKLKGASNLQCDTQFCVLCTSWLCVLLIVRVCKCRLDHCSQIRFCLMCVKKQAQFVYRFECELVIPATCLFRACCSHRTDLIVFQVSLRQAAMFETNQTVDIQEKRKTIFEIIHSVVCFIVKKEINKWPSNTAIFMSCQYSYMIRHRGIIVKLILEHLKSNTQIKFPVNEISFLT